MFFVNDVMRRNVLISCDHGLMIVNRFDCDSNMVGHGQLLMDHGNVSTVEAGITHACLQNIESPVILDIGANIGTYTTWIARAFPKSKIYCFEPQRIVFQMLCGNLAINNIDNCYTYNIGVGAVDYRITFREPDYFKNQDYGTFSLVDYCIETNQNTHIVDIVTLDTFVKNNKLNRVDFIKIDVEGMDIDVLNGASEVLKKFNPYILIEHSKDSVSSNAEVIKEILGENNYDFELIENNMLATPKHGNT